MTYQQLVSITDRQESSTRVEACEESLALIAKGQEVAVQFGISFYAP